jgi:hypothetical protein
MCARVRQGGGTGKPCASASRSGRSASFISYTYTTGWRWSTSRQPQQCGHAYRQTDRQTDRQTRPMHTEVNTTPSSRSRADTVLAFDTADTVLAFHTPLPLDTAYTCAMRFHATALSRNTTSASPQPQRAVAAGTALASSLPAAVSSLQSFPYLSLVMQEKQAPSLSHALIRYTEAHGCVQNEVRNTASAGKRRLSGSN